MKTKEEILERFEYKYIKAIQGNEELHTKDVLNLLLDIKQFLSQALAQTREETIREVEGGLNNSIYNTQGIGCGLEDNKITDRYQSAEYGYNECKREVLELLNNLTN